MKNFIRLILFFFIASIPFVHTYADGDDSGTKFTISGHVSDKSTGEDMIGATVYVKELKTGSATNVYGFYSVSLPPGNYTFEYSYVGYETLVQSFDLTHDQTFDAELALRRKPLKRLWLQEKL